MAKKNLEKATAFAEHLKNVFKPNPSEITDKISNKISSILETPHQMILHMTNLIEQEIKLFIDNQRNHKKRPVYDLTIDKVKELPQTSI